MFLLCFVVFVVVVVAAAAVLLLLYLYIPTNIVKYGPPILRHALFLVSDVSDNDEVQQQQQ